MKLNHNFEKLEQSYLFSTIARKVAQFQKENPDASVIRMGIGDVTRPLGEAVEAALVNGALEQGKAETFHGYGPEQGYDFLREAIASYYKEQIGADVNMEDVFVSDGATTFMKPISMISILSSAFVRRRRYKATPSSALSLAIGSPKAAKPF